MSSLAAFLHPVKIENQKIVVSKRFIENGKPAEWEIKAVTEKENTAIEKKYTTTDKKTGQPRVDRSAYLHELVAFAVVSPDLSNAELQKAFGALGESGVLQAMLTAGEFAKLAGEVSELSGLNANDINDQIEDAKNA
jgi:Phage XkdN-like protein.